MKKIVSLMILLMFTVPSVFSALPQNQFGKNSPKELIKDKSIAYSINYFDAINNVYKNMNISYVSSDKLNKNQIHIKTKALQSIDKNGNITLGKGAASILSAYGSFKARQPFGTDKKSIQSVEKIGLNRILEINYSNEIDPYKVCIELMKNSDIEYATPSFKRDFHAFTPNDSLFYQQWYLSNAATKNAWDISKGDTNVIIAIIDNGTDWSHDDLAGNIWVNRKEIPGNKIDDDGNGKIDDIRGWDMVGNVSTAQITANQYLEDNDPKNPSQSHGTHTAGCAAAITNNKTGIASYGFSCRIMPVKCSSDNSAVTGVYRGYEAIYYAANNGAKVINCSWGGNSSSPEELDVINFAISKGALVVASSGNEGTNNDLLPTYPACYDGVMSVGSYNRANTVSTFSNFGNSVKVYGPGENIYSTLPYNSYGNMSGTSMSSPVVAGLAALVFCVHPTWSPEQVSAQIRSTCDDAFSTTNPNMKIYYVGKINAAKALQYNNSKFAPNTVYVPGIVGKDLSINGDVALRNNAATLINLNLINYLGTADSLTVEIIALDSYIEIVDKQFSYLNFETLTTKDLSFNVKLLPNNPWFDGTARIVVKYSAPNYLDYQLFYIPIKLNSVNKYVSYLNVPSDYAIQWHGLGIATDDVAWVCGESPYIPGAIAKLTTSGSSLNQAASEVLYAVHGFTSSKAIAGSGPKSGAANIYTTINGGANWSIDPISDITPFVNGFCFFDDNNGLMLGDPIGSTWGIGKTTDAGVTWSVLAGVPSPLTGSTGTPETGFVECISQTGDKIWFGTSLGRVYSTTDRGVNWKTSTIFKDGSMSKVAFTDDKNGMAIYSETATATATRYLTTTSDGGANWNLRQIDLTSNGMYVVEIYPIPNSTTFAVLFVDGSVMKTSDLGTTWAPVLAKELQSLTVGQGRLSNNKVRLWSAGLNLGYHEFTFGATSVEDEINSTLGLRIYPNPAINSINVFLKESSKASNYQLFDSFGKIVRSDKITNLNTNLLNINATELSSGMYLLKIINNDGTYISDKVIINK